MLSIVYAEYHKYKKFVLSVVMLHVFMLTVVVTLITQRTHAYHKYIHCPMKPFLSVIESFHNRLECLSIASFSGLV